jgi:drug/metabolite transporter (DMT)-like permease
VSPSRTGVLPYAAVAFAACSWGTWAVWLRRAEAIGAMPAALEATIVMAVITAGSALSMLCDRKRRPASKRARAWVAWLGVSDAFNVLLFFAAYKITITVSVLTHYLTPVLVAVASPLLLRERLTRRTACAVAASLVGLAIMLGRPDGHVAPRALWTSAALGATSAMFYASNVVVNKFVVDDFSTSETMFWHGIVATPLLAAFVPSAAWSAVDPSAAWFLSCIAVWPGLLSALVFLWALRRMPAAHASTLTLLEPLVAVLLGGLVFGEKLGVPALVGAALILGGSLAVMTQGATGFVQKGLRGAHVGLEP